MAADATGDAAVALRGRRRPGLASLWFGLFGGPAGWTLQQLVGYAVIAQTCFPGRLPRPDGLAPGAREVAALVSVAALAVSAAAAITALRSCRASNETDSADDAVGSRIRFLAVAGVLVSTLFLLAIALSGAHLLVLRRCLG